ncbi:MAG: hypothetical protein SVU69_05820 [Pseudomonadota bacterium]|nr:hypothetical protein [Pseudomonadota bacterium]
MADSELTQERAELALTCTASMLRTLYEAGPQPANEAQSPMQRIMDSPAKDDILTLMKLLTWNIVEKLLPMMKGDSPMNPAILGLDTGRVVVEGDTAIYRIKPGRLITHWVDEKGQYKINDFEFKVNWLWVILNWRLIRDMRRKRQESEVAE